MPTAAALLMIATVLGSPAATEPLGPLEAEAPAPEIIESSEGGAVLSEVPAAALGTGAGDPLYDRLFSEPPEASAASDGSPSLPPVPPWLWLAGIAGLGGLYVTRKRKGSSQPAEGQVEVLGHTRMGAKARLTVIRVAGEDGRKRRLLVSTGEGTPALVADLGSEADDHPAPSAELRVPTGAAARFDTMLAEVAEQDELILDEPEEDGEGLGRVPPPKVPVWNETPEEFAAAPLVPASAPQPALPSPAIEAPAEQPEAPPCPLQALEQLLEDGEEAPEMVMDVSWDPETGWKGLPELAPAAGQEAAPAAEPRLDEAAVRRAEDRTPDEESWDALLEEQAHHPAPPVYAGLKPASRAAFEALLSRSSRPQASERSRRVRPVVHTVKPLRPWQQAPQRRTPYDDALVDEHEAWSSGPDIAPAVVPDRGMSPEARSQELSRSVPAPRRPMRSAQDVHDLVAEVLEERDGPDPQASDAKGNGVVELARYLRRQVAP